MKWEPLAAMLLLLLVGMWVVYAPSLRHDLRPGATSAAFQIGGGKGELEVLTEPDGRRTFRMLPSAGPASPVRSEAEMRAFLGDAVIDRAVDVSGNALFRLLHITGWGSFVWLTIGALGQTLFFGRMFIQWLVSERKRESHIPESFWWFSFFGGVMLFVYFAWRQDPIGVIGQTSGVVIYARNIRLIHKQRQRAARAAAAPSNPSTPSPAAPASA